MASSTDQDKAITLDIEDKKSQIMLVADDPAISYMLGMALKMNSHKNNLLIFNQRQSNSLSLICQHLKDNASTKLVLVDTEKMSVEQCCKLYYEIVMKTRDENKNQIRVCFLAKDKSDRIKIQHTLEKQYSTSLVSYHVMERPFTVLQVNDTVSEQLMMQMQTGDGK